MCRSSGAYVRHSTAWRARTNHGSGPLVPRARGASSSPRRARSSTQGGSHVIFDVADNEYDYVGATIFEDAVEGTTYIGPYSNVLHANLGTIAGPFSSRSLYLKTLQP